MLVSFQSKAKTPDGRQVQLSELSHFDYDFDHIVLIMIKILGLSFHSLLNLTVVVLVKSKVS